MSVYVFLGPSLPLGAARDVGVENVTFLPPARMGDVHEVARKQPTAICIVDGVFERVPAVWHKEILFALSQGIRVVGASSIGALRGAELHEFGMEGVGTVFSWYRDGRIDADDEVALLHGPADTGYRGLSEPLVNIRDGLDRAVAAGLATAELAERLLAAMKERFYPERSWEGLFETSVRLGVAPEDVERLRTFVQTEKPNVKRDDALAALHYVKNLPARPERATSDEWTFEPTDFWMHLLATKGREGSTPRRDLTAHALLFGPEPEALARAGLLYALVEKAARESGIQVSPEKLAAAARAFREARGLTKASDFRDWLEKSGVPLELLHRALSSDVVAQELERAYRYDVDKGMIVELARLGRLGSTAQACASGDSTFFPLSPEDMGVTRKELTEWYRAETGRATLHHRLVDPSDATTQALRAYVAQQAAAKRWWDAE